MTQKERKQEKKELEDAVKVLRATLRSIAQRKARRFEQEFMLRVRDMIDEEISDMPEVNEYSANYIGSSFKTEILKD